MRIQIDDHKHATHTLSMLLLDDALGMLIKDGELDALKLCRAIDTAKEKLFGLNQDNDDTLTKMSIVVTAHALQCRYLAL